MKIAFHIFADFELIPKVNSGNAVYREVVRTTCSSNGNKQAFLELDFLDYEHATYFKELMLAHRLKKVENRYNFST